MTGRDVAARTYVVTGGGRGVGRAIVDRLARGGGHVVIIEADPSSLTWTRGHPAADRIATVVGDAADEDLAEDAADRAEEAGRLTGWVNNAARFRPPSVEQPPAEVLLRLINENLAPAVVGSAVAVRRFLGMGGGGSIVNVSSHQAGRPVRGGLPYATAKAAVEGLTRALAVDQGYADIRVNAVALGTIHTERYAALLARQGPDAAADTEERMRAIHPLGRVGRAEEVAAVVAYLLSADSAFITGTVIPVDGGRSVWGPDPEEIE